MPYIYNPSESNITGNFETFIENNQRVIRWTGTTWKGRPYRILSHKFAELVERQTDENGNVKIVSAGDLPIEAWHDKTGPHSIWSMLELRQWKDGVICQFCKKEFSGTDINEHIPLCAEETKRANLLAKAQEVKVLGELTKAVEDTKITIVSEVAEKKKEEIPTEVDGIEKVGEKELDKISWPKFNALKMKEGVEDPKERAKLWKEYRDA